MNSQLFLELAFGLCIGLLCYIYCGYPFLLWIVAKCRRTVPLNRPSGQPLSANQRYYPTVTIAIAAHNEESCIGRTIENKLQLDYPTDRMEILVASDASTDRTEAIVRSYCSRGVRLFRQDSRRGKASALDSILAEATGQILVFSDANSIFDPGALLALVRNFRDRQVGYVTGRTLYLDQTGSIIGAGCSAYMRYENALKRLETTFGSTIGVDGGIDAMRRHLLKTIPTDELPDLYLPLLVLSQGYRVVYEEQAILFEPSLTRVPSEWAMRVRVSMRAFRTISTMRHLLNPFRYPRTAFQLLSHKVLRYLAGLLQIGAFASNLALVAAGPPYLALFGAQLVFYLAAFAGATRVGARSAPAAKYVFYFCLLNAAAIAALFRFLRGERRIVWTPREG